MYFALQLAVLELQAPSKNLYLHVQIGQLQFLSTHKVKLSYFKFIFTNTHMY